LNEAQNEAANNGSIFDIGSSREQQRNKIAKQMAVAEAIRSRPGIEDASVIYDESKTTTFEPKLAKAVVNVWPIGSNELDEAAVIDIRNAVVGAYVELKPENVTVCDINGHTWRGSVGSADEIRYSSRKRSCEQDLKAKILGLGVLSHVSNVTVELNVELDRTLLTPTSARVSICVPNSYFKQVWQDRNPVAPGHAEKTPDAAALDQIRNEESANIQRCVATLLPRATNVAGQANVVTVTTYQEISATLPSVPAWSGDAWNWIVQWWKVVASVGFALVCLLMLRSMVSGRSAETEEEAISTVPPPPAGKTSAKTATVAPPHWRRDAGAVDRSLREELSELVEADPETAANILRNWIGQTG
jgi:flagellar biosynthesis/type III secretory pathway M-ring protein FliF/YscJ